MSMPQAPAQTKQRPTSPKMRIDWDLEQLFTLAAVIAVGVTTGLLGFVIFVHLFGLNWVGNL